MTPSTRLTGHLAGSRRRSLLRSWPARICAVTVLGTLAALVLPADAQQASTSVVDAGDDTYRGADWVRATPAQRDASELLSATYTLDRGDDALILLARLTHLPAPRRTFTVVVSADASIGDQQIRLHAQPGYSEGLRVDGKPGCPGQVVSEHSLREGTVTITVPLSCLPEGKELVGLTTEVATMLSPNPTYTTVGRDFSPATDLRIR